MTGDITIPCPRCGTRNRIPSGKRAEAGKCGRCGSALFDGHPIALDAAGFDRHAGTEDLPLLVDFWASWCGPCKAMAPAYEAATQEFEPRIRFAKIDTDAESGLAARFNIRAIPTLILFRGGREVARHSGALSAGGLRQWISEQLVT